MMKSVVLLILRFVNFFRHGVHFVRKANEAREGTENKSEKNNV